MNVITTASGRTRITLTAEDPRRIFTCPAQEGINGGRPAIYRVESIEINNDGTLWVWAAQLTRKGVPYVSGMGLNLGDATGYGEDVAEVVREAVAQYHRREAREAAATKAVPALVKAAPVKASSSTKLSTLQIEALRFCGIPVIERQGPAPQSATLRSLFRRTLITTSSETVVHGRETIVLTDAGRFLVDTLDKEAARATAKAADAVKAAEESASVLAGVQRSDVVHTPARRRTPAERRASVEAAGATVLAETVRADGGHEMLVSTPEITEGIVTRGNRELPARHVRSGDLVSVEFESRPGMWIPASKRVAATFKGTFEASKLALVKAPRSAVIYARPADAVANFRALADANPVGSAAWKFWSAKAADLTVQASA